MIIIAFGYIVTGKGADAADVDYFNGKFVFPKQIGSCYFTLLNSNHHHAGQLFTLFIGAFLVYGGLSFIVS